ncbi:MAG: hypothetical protein GY863_23900, partial [bacterium]|nr:hypothetical protein [bacterium]
DVIIEDMFSENWWNDENLPTPLSAFWSDRINVTDELYPAYEYYFDKFLQGLITTKIRFFVTNEEDTRWRRDFEDQFSDWIFRRTYEMPVDTMHHLVRNYTMNELQPSTKNNYFHSVMRYKGQKIHQLLREIVPEEKHKEILRTFIQKHSYRTSTISDFQAVCEEVTGESLGWYFNDWLRGKAFPGFYISSIDTYKLKGGKTGVQYLVEVNVKNGEPDFGYVKVLLRTENDAVQKNSEVEGNEEVKFGFLIDDQPDEVIIDPVFSQNHGSIRKNIQIPDRFDKRSPWEGIRKIRGSFSFSSPVIIDDMDDNFTLKPVGDPKFFRPKEGERNWRVRTDSEAYGKYKFTYRRKEAGSGMVPAVWTTELRASGLYDVQVYVFKGSNRWTRRWLEENVSPDFNYIIDHREGSESVELNWHSVPHGWNSIGRFYFDKDKQAVITLEDRGDGLLLADAVQLIPVRVNRNGGKQ